MRNGLFLFSVVFSLLVFLCVSVPLWSVDGIYLFASLDKNKITIGDKVKLTIVIKCSEGVKIGQFEPEGNLKSFEIKNYKISKKGKKYEYTLSTFLTGIYEIPPFKVKWITPDGKEAESQSSILKLEVVSLLDKESASDIRDIKPPVNFQRGIIFYATIFGCLLLFVGYLIYRYNTSQTDTATVLEKIIDPYEYIISELQKLQSSNLIEEGKIKEFFIQLSFIVRVYVSKIFAVDILDMTTAETLKTLRKKDADRKFLLQLQDFLETSDLVKFAKYVPDKKEVETIFEDVKTMVEAVKPQI
ncbi:MAG: BatD family protein [Elusimicrobiota bacterium]